MAEGNKKLDAKASVRVATINSVSNLKDVDTSSIDGITLEQGDRVLVKDTASKDGIEVPNSKRNGIYNVRKVVGTSATLQRSQDANRDKEVTAGMFTFVEEGVTNKDTGWLLITDNPISLDITSLNFIKFTGAGEISANIQAAIDRNSDNIVLNAFRIATLHSLTLSNMVDGFVDEYEDESGIDNAASIDELFNSVESLYETENNNIKLLLHFNGLDGQTTTVDSSPAGHTVTLIGQAKLDTSIKQFGSASLELDGTGDSASIPDSADFDLVGASNTNYTISLFVKFANHTGTEYILTQREDGANRWILNHIDGTGFRLLVISGGVIKQDISGGEITDTNQHHVAVTRVGSEYAIYVDGVQVAYESNTFTDTYAGDLFLAEDGTGFTNLEGHLDEVLLESANTFAAAPNVGLTDTITVPTAEFAGGSVNTTLISEAVTAQTQADDARIVIFEQDIDIIVLNTDLKAFISRDDGVTYSEVTLVNEGEYETGRRVLAASIDISSQPVGTAMRYKIVTANLKGLKLHGTGLSWA